MNQNNKNCIEHYQHLQAKYPYLFNNYQKVINEISNNEIDNGETKHNEVSADCGNIMNLDEALEHCKEKFEGPCGDAHRQLYNWLCELKMYRENLYKDNLQQYKGPEYNKLNTQDTLSVQEAKIAAQQSWIDAQQ